MLLKHLATLHILCLAVCLALIIFHRNHIFKILVIDEDDVFLQLMKIRLERLFSCMVTIVNCYSRAIPEAKHNPYDIFICEYSPERTFSAFDFMKSFDNSMKKTQAIITTIEDDPSIARTASSLGFAATVVKTNRFFSKLQKSLSDLGVPSQRWTEVF